MGSLTIDLRWDGEKQQISRIQFHMCGSGFKEVFSPDSCLSVNSLKKSLTWETSLVVWS